MPRILIIRFSSIGDVAMTIPVIYSFAARYPEQQITVLSRKVLQPLFDQAPLNVTFIGADLKGKHKGLQGLNRLFKELAPMNFDYVADLHHVLRTRYLALRFKMLGALTAHIEKGRPGKKKLVRRFHKVMENQKTSFIRYQEVLNKLGFSFQLDFTSIYGTGCGDFSQIKDIAGAKGNCCWIGIAPFAKHESKIYPLHLMEKVVAHFSGNTQIKVFLFGGGEKEKAVLEDWENKYPGVVSTIGKLKMHTELILMSHLDVMLSMDSANMHLASLVNIPVVSVWGATHPYAGFMGWKQLPAYTVQLDMRCRPCSVFGQKPCYRKDYACLHQITPQMVVRRIESILI